MPLTQSQARLASFALAHVSTPTLARLLWSTVDGKRAARLDVNVFARFYSRSPVLCICVTSFIFRPVVSGLSRVSRNPRPALLPSHPVTSSVPHTGPRFKNTCGISVAQAWDTQACARRLGEY